MKKIKFIFAAALTGTMLMFSACTKSNEDLINEYREAAQEWQTAVANGDLTKVPAASEKLQKIANELDQRELTVEQKTEIGKITAECGQEAITGIMDTAKEFSDTMEDIFGGSDE